MKKNYKRIAALLSIALLLVAAFPLISLAHDNDGVKNEVILRAPLCTTCREGYITTETNKLGAPQQVGVKSPCLEHYKTTCFVMRQYYTVTETCSNSNCIYYRSYKIFDEYHQ